MALKTTAGMRHIRLLGRGRLTVAFRIVAWMLRLTVGATFVFSGFSKAVDPYGTLYKIADYAAAVDWNMPFGLLLVAAFILFTGEFVVGAMLLLGCFRRSTALCATLIMAVMLPISLWLAIANPVADCGCFGDAMVISNWATFWKNVGLTAACVWLMFFNGRIHWLVTPALQWIALTLSISFPACLGLMGYVVQPPLDFRPFKVGTVLFPQSETEHGDENVKLIYKDRNGEEKAFSLSDELPEENDGWTFIRQEESNIKAGKPAGEAELRIWSADGEEDVTADAIVFKGKQLILFMPSLSEVSVRDTWPVNSLYSYCLANDIDMIAVAAASQQAIDMWEDISMSEYPVYTAEDTAIKEVVRGNPALVYLEDGKIVWKQTLGSIDLDTLTAPGSTLNLRSVADDTYVWMRKVTVIYIVLLAFLILISFMPPALRLRKLIRRRRRIEKAMKISH